MKHFFVITLFLLATLALATAQQPGSAPDQSAPNAPSSQAPTQSQPSSPGTADQSGAPGQASNATITEGCLGGSEPNYTLTDSSGTTFKLNMPAKANTSGLASHVGESVQVKGDVKNTSAAGTGSIDVQAIGRGTGKCPAGSAQPPKQ